MRLVALTCAVFFGLVGSASAVQLVNPDGTRAEPFQTWADASYVPSVPFTVTVIPVPFGTCGTAAACTSQSPAAIYVTSPPLSRPDLMHELGHQFDFAMPEWKRNVVRKILGFAMPWYAATPHLNLSYSETFAAIYDECAVRWSPGPAYFYADGEGGDEITVRQFRRLCKLIRQPQ